MCATQTLTVSASVQGILVGRVGGNPRNGGRYDAVPYRYFGRAKTSRNPKDDAVHANRDFVPVPDGIELQLGITDRPAIPATNAAENTPRAASERVERILLPRRLCWLDQNPPTREYKGVLYKVYQSTDVQEVCAY